MTEERPFLGNFYIKNAIVREFLSEFLGTFILVVSILLFKVALFQSY